MNPKQFQQGRNSLPNVAAAVLLAAAVAVGATVVHGACDTPSFSSVKYQVGNFPAAVAVADMNGDNVDDIVVANADDNTVWVLLSNKGGGFTGATNVTVGTGPVALTAADFNSDGNLDIAVVNTLSSNVTILLGDGTGGIASKTNVSVGAYPYALAAGDLNNDGVFDLAVVNNGNNNVSILLGNGSGGFAAQTPAVVGHGPDSLALGDFNRDGKMDLAVGNYDDGAISILLGNGSGEFTPAPQSSITVKDSPEWTLTADLNRDDKLDLVVVDSFDDTVSVMLGDGAGGFGAPVSYPVGFFPVTAAVADLSGDGNLDLAVSNAGDRNVSVLFGNGSGGFAAGTTFGTGTNAQQVVVGDFNGDMQPDLAIGNADERTLSVLTGTCPGYTFAPVRLRIKATDDSTVELRWADKSINETGFRVQQGFSVEGPFNTIVDLPSNNGFYIDTNAVAGFNNFYRIQALNSSGGSDYSPVSSTMPQISTQVPAIATDVSAVAIAPGLVRLTWTDTANNESAFRVQRGRSATGPWANVATAGAGITEYIDRNPIPGRVYYYRIRTTNPTGHAKASNVTVAAVPTP